MARPATGAVVERRTGGGTTYAIRFRAYGQREYLTLGTTGEGWSRERAEAELANVLADVRRGLWRPPSRTAVEAAPDPTFHEFASEWLEAVSPGLAPRTVERYRWQLESHLLPVFCEHRLSEITVSEVDRYREAKARERASGDALVADLSAALGHAQEAGGDVSALRARLADARRTRGLTAGEINKTLIRLGQILDVADERELITRNPLRVNPKRRKLKAPKPRAVWLDRAEQIVALLDAGSELDGEARGDRRHIPRRAILEAFVYAGLRIEELCALRWRDVDLAAGRLNVAQSKTDAGRRHVELLAPLRESLATHKAGGDGTGYVFATASGGAPSRDNVRNRVFNVARERANENLEREGLTPLPEGLTPHKLRHTFASLLVALGKDPITVSDQIGHSDPAFTLRVYGHVMRQGEAEKKALRALVEGSHWAPMGTNHDFGPAFASDGESPEKQKTPPERGFRGVGRAGLEPATSALSRRRSPS